MVKKLIPGHRVLILLALAATLQFAPLAHAQATIDQKSIDRAHAFLLPANRGKDVLSYVHFGTQYKSHTYQETKTVINRPGHFALVYKYNWDKDGVTQLAFLCDPKGNVYQVQVVSTNAVLSQPYAVANLSISVLGNAILEAFRNQMSKEDVQQVRQFIDNPNARGLLEMSLKLQQSLTR